MSWDDEAPGWDTDPAVRAYSEAAFQSLREVLGERGTSLTGARVLDFGCGTGLLTALIASEAAAVVGLDISGAMLDVLRAKQLDNVTVTEGPLDTSLGRFDVVTASSVLAFVEDYPGTVALLVSLLAPGGLFVQWDWELDPSAEEAFGLTRPAVQAALEAAGLRDVVVDTAFSIPFGDMTMAPIRGVGRR